METLPSTLSKSTFKRGSNKKFKISFLNNAIKIPNNVDIEENDNQNKEGLTI